MNSLNPTILAALITSICSLAVSIITLWNNRSGEKKKLVDAIKTQELQNKLTALHQSIEVLQKIKNLLKDILIDIELNNLKPIQYYYESTSEIIKTYHSIYSSYLGSLSYTEQRLLHDGTGLLIKIEHYLFALQKKNQALNIEMEKNKIVNFRNLLGDFQEKYQSFKNELLKRH